MEAEAALEWSKLFVESKESRWLLEAGGRVLICRLEKVVSGGCWHSFKVGGLVCRWTIRRQEAVGGGWSGAVKLVC